MSQFNFYLCDNDTTVYGKEKAISPPRGYQAERLSQCNPSAIPCSNGGSTSQAKAIAKQLNLMQEVR